MEDSADTPPPPEPGASRGLRVEAEFIESLPVAHWEGDIVLVESLKAAEKAVAQLAKERVLGFDTETRPVFGRPSYIFKVRDRGGRADKVIAAESKASRELGHLMRGKSIEESYLWVNGKASFPGHYVRPGDTVEIEPPKNLPAILQLAGEHCVYIFRLHGPMRQPLLHCGGLAPVFPLLCNPRQAKVGVAVRDDVKNLQARAPFDSRGFIDIADFTKKAGIENTGLRALAAHYLNRQMKKSKKVQTSHWDEELQDNQIQYAANDAWYSRELFLELEKRGIAPRFE